MPDPSAPGSTDPSPIRAHISEAAQPRFRERTSVIDSIVAEIKGKIIAGDLKDGDVLASQDVLAREMGVSRASLREALNRLSLMGLVETRHGSGTYIKTAKPADYMDSLSSMLIMDRASAGELLQARFYVEAALAGLAATNAPPESMAQMRRLLDQMRKAHERGDNDGFVSLDARFHLLIAESSGNRVLIKVLEVIRDLLPLCIRRFHLTFPERVPVSMNFHEKVYEGIATRNAKAAARAMESHIGFLMKLNDESEAATSHISA